MAGTSPTLTKVPTVEQGPDPQNTSSSTVQPTTPAYGARHGRRERRCRRSLGVATRTWSANELHQGERRYMQEKPWGCHHDLECQWTSSGRAEMQEKPWGCHHDQECQWTSSGRADYRLDCVADNLNATEEEEEEEEEVPKLLHQSHANRFSPRSFSFTLEVATLQLFFSHFSNCFWTGLHSSFDLSPCH